MKKICVFVGFFSLSICIHAGCGKNTAKTEDINPNNTINEIIEETNIPAEETVEEVVEEESIEEDLSGIVPLSKRVNKGKMIAFGCMGGLHDGYVFKIFFFEHGKATVVTNLEPIGEYGGFELPSLEELSTKSEEELWGLCDDFKKNSVEFVAALKTNNEDAFSRLTDPNSPDFDLSFAEAVNSQPDSGEIYNIVLPVIDAPFVISIESDETNSIASVEQIIIATQSVSKTYGGTVSIDGGVDADFSITNMAEGGEIEIGNKMCSVYPAFECNLAYLCVKADEGFYFDPLDIPEAYINNQETAYNDASKLLVK